MKRQSRIKNGNFRIKLSIIYEKVFVYYVHMHICKKIIIILFKRIQQWIFLYKKGYYNKGAFNVIQLTAIEEVYFN